MDLERDSTNLGVNLQSGSTLPSNSEVRFGNFEINNGSSSCDVEAHGNLKWDSFGGHSLKSDTIDSNSGGFSKHMNTIIIPPLIVDLNGRVAWENCLVGFFFEKRVAFHVMQYQANRRLEGGKIKG